jgi:hypothetical protein
MLSVAADVGAGNSPAERERALALAPRIAAYWSAPPVLINAAREEAQAQLALIAIRFCQLDEPVRPHLAAITGEYPIVSTDPSFDMVGLEAESGFSYSYDEAVRLGERLLSTIGDDFGEVDLEY